MLVNINYDRYSAYEYAKEWAYKRNPKYYNFDGIGGDCTNFISQCIFAGCGVMNYKPTYGWYYITSGDRAPAWSGVNFLFNFLTSNQVVGPFGSQVSIQEVAVGDVIQLGNDLGFYHSLFVVNITSNDIFIATHTSDAFMRSLRSYYYERIRCIHIAGARKYY